jgi:hypothetical protein
VPSAYQVEVLSNTLPTSALSGGSGTATVRVARLTPGLATTYVSLFASSDAQLDASDTALLSSPAITKVVAGRARSLKLKFTYPAADGPVYLLARASASAAPAATPGAIDDVAAIQTPIAIAPANAAINVTSLNVSPSASLAIGKGGSATLIVTNAGNVSYKGTLQIALDASANDAEGSDLTLTTLTKRISIKAGASKRLKIKFALPAGFAFRSFQPVARVTPSPVAGVTVTGGGIVGTQVVAVAG